MNNRLWTVLGILIMMAGSCMPLVREEGTTTYLSDLKPNEVARLYSYGQDMDYADGTLKEYPLTFRNSVYRKGVVTVPLSGSVVGHVRYDLQERFSRLRAKIAMLDLSRSSGDAHGNVNYYVISGEDEILIKGSLSWNRSPSHSIDIDIRGVGQLKLAVDDANGWNYSDHVAWLDARVY